MWNIRGIQTIRTRKLLDPAVQEITSNHDIIGFVESHTDIDSIISVEGFTTFHNPRPKNRHRGKMYGGVVVLVRNTLINGIKEIKPTTEGCLWLELQADFFHRENDILLGYIYIEPGITKKADPLKHVRKGLENWNPDTPLIPNGGH